MKPKVIYASDYRGVELREELVKKGYNSGFEIIDLGIPKDSPLDYIDISIQLAEELHTKPEAFGVIICGSGQGVAVALNRYAHIRACLCRTVDDAIQIRKKQNANVICLGSKHNTPEESTEIFTKKTEGLDEKLQNTVRNALGAAMGNIEKWAKNHFEQQANEMARRLDQAVYKVENVMPAYADIKESTALKTVVIAVLISFLVGGAIGAAWIANNTISVDKFYKKTGRQ